MVWYDGALNFYLISFLVAGFSLRLVIKATITSSEQWPGVCCVGGCCAAEMTGDCRGTLWLHSLLQIAALAAASLLVR